MLRSKRFIWPMTLMLCVSMGLLGCETAGGSAATGALVGAGLGAVIGHQSGNAGTGAAIGAALGALAGYAVHKSRTRQTQTAAQTYDQYDYEPQKGFQLDVREGDVTPSVVEPGGTVKATMEYATLGTDGGVRVQEARVLKTQDDSLTLDEETVTRSDGTWQNTLEFQVPDDAPAGQYRVTQKVAAQGKSASEMLIFNVQPQQAKADGQPQRYVVTMHVEK